MIDKDAGTVAQVQVEEIEELKRVAIESLAQADNQASIERWRVAYLGRKGSLTSVLRNIGDLPLESRKSVGEAANGAMRTLNAALEDRKARIAPNYEPSSIDVTLPGRLPRRGRLHPSTVTIREIVQAFNAMGFATVEGPEIELERYNFDLLNIPDEHPARDLWDTLWLNSESDEKFLLRTHTSPMQVRTMQTTRPPLRIVVPGKCYRHEATNATHEWQFHQIEGLAVGEGITFSHLKGTLYEFARRVFGSERQVRFRCDFFPFVEPGVDMSIDCFKCSGAGCRVCSFSGWIEILGAGMVHPKVLQWHGIDTSKITGFAFGMGPERIAMLRHGIDDIRRFFSNELRFLTQFP